MKRYTAGLWALLVSVGLVFGTIVDIQPAAASETVTCDSGFGTKVPVLLVHGFDSNPRMWSEGNPSMVRVLGDLGGAYVARPFSYEDNHFDWVTNDNIGPKLARTIDCLAQTSLGEGGAGKVIVVAHSMGGLAARFAANQTIDGRKVADELGLVVTLGTPNTGTPWATAFGDLPRAYCRLLVDNSLAPEQRMEQVSLCWASSALIAMREGSSELAQLPPFPGNVPVRAIAGKVTVYGQYLFGEVKQSFSDDLIVPVSSALAEYTNKGVGDGRFVFQCDIRHYDSYGFNGFQGGQCSHNEMYKTGYVQQSVANGISDYLASRSRPVGATAYTVGDGMVIYLPSNAQVVGLSGEGPNATGVTCFSGTCPAFEVYNPNEVGGSDALGWRNWELSRCNDASGQITQKAVVQAGGKSAHYYEAATCKPGAPRSTVGFWYVDDSSAFVIAVDLDSRGRDEINAILTGASWK